MKVTEWIHDDSFGSDGNERNKTCSRTISRSGAGCSNAESSAAGSGLLTSASCRARTLTPGTHGWRGRGRRRFFAAPVLCRWPRPFPAARCSSTALGCDCCRLAAVAAACRPLSRSRRCDRCSRCRWDGSRDPEKNLARSHRHTGWEGVGRNWGRARWSLAVRSSSGCCGSGETRHSHRSMSTVAAAVGVSAPSSCSCPLVCSSTGPWTADARKTARCPSSGLNLADHRSGLSLLAVEVVGRFLASEVGQVCRRQFLAEEQVCSRHIGTAAAVEDRLHRREVCCTLNSETTRIRRSFRNWKAGWRTTADLTGPFDIPDLETWLGFVGFRDSGWQDRGIRWFRRGILADSKTGRIRSYR